MVKAKFVYRKTDNVFIGGGFYDAQPPMVARPNDPITGQSTQVPDYVNYGVAEFGDADQPDLKRHRYDSVNGKRLATMQELADADDADVTQHADLTSHQKDILTTVAYIVRRTNVAAWNAMTPAEKRAAVMTQADIWRDLRVMAEKLW